MLTIDILQATAGARLNVNRARRHSTHSRKPSAIEDVAIITMAGQISAMSYCRLSLPEKNGTTGKRLPHNQYGRATPEEYQ